MRQNYLRVCRLVELVDDNIGPLIVMSVSIDLVFICTQLFHSFRWFKSIKQKLSKVWHSKRFMLCWNFDVVSSSLSFSGSLELCNCRILPSASSWFGLILMIARALSVFVTASHINTESRRTIKILNRVPTNFWSMEVNRFSREIVCSRVALSGCKLFHLNYDLILTVAGTITSYELYLMQLELEL